MTLNINPDQRRSSMDKFTVGELIAHLTDNHDPKQEVVLEETSNTADDAVALPDVFQAMKEDHWLSLRAPARSIQGRP